MVDYSSRPSRGLLPERLMLLRTVEQVRRLSRIVGGFTLLLIGIVMLVTPGPGWLVILLGLGLLAAEFVWAKRLMDRIKREGERMRSLASVRRARERERLRLHQGEAEQIKIVREVVEIP